MVKTVQICTAGECGGECYRCRSKELYERITMLQEVLSICYRALTEGMEDIPAGERYSRCSRLRVEAKRRIREVLGEEVDIPGRVD